MARFKTCTSQYERVSRNTQVLTAGLVSYFLKILLNLALFCATAGADAVLAAAVPTVSQERLAIDARPPSPLVPRSPTGIKMVKPPTAPVHHRFSRISEICHFFAPQSEALRF
jgi:hypothetical protein